MMQASKQTSKKTDFTAVDLLWWGSLRLAKARPNYFIIHLIFKFLIIKFTIETILKCVKNKVYTS